MKKMSAILSLVLVSSTVLGANKSSINTEFARLSTKSLKIVHTLEETLERQDPSASVFCYYASRLDLNLMDISQIEVPTKNNGEIEIGYENAERFLSIFRQPIFGSKCGVLPGVQGRVRRSAELHAADVRGGVSVAPVERGGEAAGGADRA